MVVGLDKFAEHFAAYQDRYILIGGTATWLVLDEAGITARATKDLDIVLCVESLDASFAEAFWEFVQLAGYEIQERSDGSKVFYRFIKPAQPEYPAMLELFSRKPDDLVLGNDNHLTPIPIGHDIDSLSAILLNDNYYHFLHEHKQVLGGVSIVSEKCLIPLKARAWLDLTRRKKEGEQIDAKNIRKHRNDVLRLSQLLVPGLEIMLTEEITKDLNDFLIAVETEITVQDLKVLEIRQSAPEILKTLRAAYQL